MEKRKVESIIFSLTLHSPMGLRHTPDILENAGEKMGISDAVRWDMQPHP